MKEIKHRLKDRHITVHRLQMNWWEYISLHVNNVENSTRKVREKF